ncbi:MAG TPA: PA2169 family four-helix-bundle protein [Ramlibacter sp.]|jgi:uncharacterized protein (TIGR02284 family)|uniref:ferritin-like domain-containing protein n=1 Tax=Ramlibacter sp. TaxID=1917967 RepID=UPI002D32D18B|nr:PA2169 family four-helix-bundle protein [Ramlibacter sp.]HZY18895.1 PA2169 family four-helix-bundle protein [Ramlibacter sp.]
MAAEDKDLNRDPLTDEPGAHPVGTGVGAAGGAMAGAAAGTIGGPVGTLVGGVIGAVVGGLAGKAAAEAVNPTAEESHWRDNYTREPYYEQGRTFDDYGPAYMHGVRGRMQHDTDWDAAEPRLASEWQASRASSGLDWQQARPATRAAWDRVETLRTGTGTGTAGGTGLTGGMGATGGSGALGGGSGAMGSDTAMVRANDLAGGSSAGSLAGAAGTDLVGSSIGMDQDIGGRSSAAGMGTTGLESGRGIGREADAGSGITGGTGSTGGPTGSTLGSGMGGGTGAAQNTGAAGLAGAVQSAGNTSGDRGDVVDALQDLVECCKDGEYGFRESAEQAKSQDLKQTFLQRADDCRRGAEQLNQEIRGLGGSVEDAGSALGAMHRGWVSVKSKLTTYDDKAVLEECERGEDNALARYRKALQQPLPPQVKQLVERQYQGVQRNHDEIKRLRNEYRARGNDAGNASPAGGSTSTGGGMGTTGMAAGAGAGLGLAGGSSMGQSQSQSSGLGSGSGQDTGAAGWVGSAQSAGNTSGDRTDVIDALTDLVECCKDGEYGFRESAERTDRQDLKSLFQQRADDCRRGADELNQQILGLGGQVETGGSAMGAVHRGWVSVKSALSTQDDKAVLEECERGEDNALARYRKALKQPLPEQIKQVVERQYQGVQRNHDQIKMLRDQFRAAS